MTWILGTTLEQIERDAIIAALKYFNGNRTKAAQILGISIRTILNKIAKYQEQNFEIPPAVFGRNYESERKNAQDEGA